tara:strand:+ start:11247 stop:11612 length:366 start_codon:yes stop_codon:yes gene_type:complete
MKRLLLPLLALLIPSAHATNYVECEAIRSVITRNNIQLENAIKDSYLAFKSKLINEKFQVNNCSEIEFEYVDNLDCRLFAEKIPDSDSEEYKSFFIAYTQPYRDIDKRASSDFKKRGCYYF